MSAVRTRYPAPEKLSRHGKGGPQRDANNPPRHYPSFDHASPADDVTTFRRGRRHADGHSEMQSSMAQTKAPAVADQKQSALPQQSLAGSAQVSAGPWQ